MQYNYNKLKGRSVEMCGTQAIFAEKIGLSENSLTNKLNGKRNFKQPEIQKALEVLDLTTDDIPVYFFNRKVQNF